MNGPFQKDVFQNDAYQVVGAAAPVVLDVDGGGGWGGEQPRGLHWLHPRPPKHRRLRGRLTPGHAPAPVARLRFQRHVRVRGMVYAWRPSAIQGRSTYIESAHELALIASIAEASFSPDTDALGTGELDLLLALSATQEDA